LVPLRDPDLISQLRRRAEGLVDDGAIFRPEAVREHRWAVVPVESALHFDHNDATRLAEAIGRVTEEVYAVAVEGLQNVEAAYRVRATPEGLMSFSSECGLFGYVLLPPESGLFAVLCSVADYYLVAGPVPFVEEAIGANVAVAIHSFDEFASDHAFPAEKQAGLKRLISMYRAAD
jgi:hypothetical protein